MNYKILTLYVDEDNLKLIKDIKVFCKTGKISFSKYVLYALNKAYKEKGEKKNEKENKN